MRGRAKRRAALVCAFLAVIFTGYSARLIYLQVGKHEEYTALAASKHSIRQTIPARRGMIMDRNGEILAASMPVRKVIIDGTHIKDPVATAKTAAPFLGISEEVLTKEFTAQVEAKKAFKIVVQELPEDQAMACQKALEAKNLRGLYFYPGTIRTYSNRSMLSHILGYLSRKNPEDDHLVGVEGVERAFDSYLSGEDGFRHIERDRTGREIVVYRGQEQAPKQGMNVQLTIDMGIQSILEKELDSAFKELKPETAIGIIVNPKTGEILAMANRPNYDLNDINGANPAAMKNRSIMDMVEPGSTFKIVVASGALNEHVVTDKTQIFCENGRFAYGGKTLKDHHGYGNMNVHDILVKSSNIGSAKMALMMGDEKYYEYVRRFGFGEKTGVSLPGEISGLVHPPHRWDKLTITRMAMGHSVAVTPLQIVMGMAVIANGGQLMRPQIVRSVKDENDQEVTHFAPEVVREVVPKEVAEYVKNSLMGVVDDGGTATLARVNGYTIAGKTGTAQKVNPKGGYADGKYVVSFCGFMPAEDPQLVCLIMVDDAKIASNLNYGGLVAAPIFSRVAEKAARYLDIVPSPEASAILPVAMQSGTNRPVRQ